MQFAVSMVDVIGLLGAPLLVLLVGVLTRVTTSSGVKAVLLLVFSAVDGLIVEFLSDPGSFNLGMALLKALSVFLVAVNTHFGFLKPVGVTRYLQENVGLRDAQNA